MDPTCNVRFVEEGHRYFLSLPGKEGEIEVPSITQVTGLYDNWDGIDPDTLARAADRGHAIHRGCELLAQGILDWDSVDPSIEPYIRAFGDWLGVSHFETQVAEYVVGDADRLAAGRLDLVGLIGKYRWIVEIKSGGATYAHRPQTAGQEILLRGYEGIPARTRIRRGALYLDKNRGHKWVEHEDPSDHTAFLAALTVTHIKRRNAA